MKHWLYSHLHFNKPYDKPYEIRAPLQFCVELSFAIEVSRDVSYKHYMGYHGLPSLHTYGNQVHTSRMMTACGPTL